MGLLLRDLRNGFDREEAPLRDGPVRSRGDGGAAPALRQGALPAITNDHH